MSHGVLRLPLLDSIPNQSLSDNFVSDDQLRSGELPCNQLNQVGVQDISRRHHLLTETAADYMAVELDKSIRS